MLHKNQTVIERQALNWNSHGQCIKGRPRITWRGTVEEEAGVPGRIWGEEKAMASQHWQCFIRRSKRTN